jgi:tRNA A37 threonylcarbamoyladenosine dehydratase
MSENLNPTLNNAPALQRLELLVGASALESLAATRVILFGLGGVGSWCAEALIRSGIGTLAIVDSDVVCVTNINRQVQAVPSTVGNSKCAELAKRLRDIQPLAAIIELPLVFDKTTADGFDLGQYDYVIDAIDSLSSKVELIIKASQSGAKVYSALGASNKLDPTRIAVAPLWDSYNCRLGKFVRKRLRRRGFNGDVTCIYSPEEREPFKGKSVCGTGKCLCPKAAMDADGATRSPHEWCSSKKQINGSAVHITGTFGFMLAGLVVQDVAGKEEQTRAHREHQET